MDCLIYLVYSEWALAFSVYQTGLFKQDIAEKMRPQTKPTGVSGLTCEDSSNSTARCNLIIKNISRAWKGGIGYLSIYLSIHSPFFLSIYLPMYLSIYTSVFEKKRCQKSFYPKRLHLSFHAGLFFKGIVNMIPFKTSFSYIFFSIIIVWFPS